MAEDQTVRNKEKFFEENREFTEIKSTQELTTIGDIQDIDELDDDIWLMQCPKGSDVTGLQKQKLKLPGRSHVDNLEAIAVEFNDPISQAFGYCNPQGKYALRLLTIKGSIVLRHRLKATEPVTENDIESISPGLGRVLMPSGIKVRHPLLGVQFEEKSNMNQEISERLKKADKQSARILSDTLFRSFKTSQTKNVKPNAMIEAIEINSGPESDNQNKTKKKKSKKRKTSESSNTSKKWKKIKNDIFD